MAENNIQRNLFSVEYELERAGINSRYLKVETDPNTHTVTISLGAIPLVARKYLAKKILHDADFLKADFYNNGRLTSCVYHVDDHRVSIGNAYCSPTDTYDMLIGEAIAYQRAKYGKVLDTDLLG